MRFLHAVLRKRFVMHRMRGLGVEADVELVFPAELESRLAHRVVADLSAGEPPSRGQRRERRSYRR